MIILIIVAGCLFYWFNEEIFDLVGGVCEYAVTLAPTARRYFNYGLITWAIFFFLMVAIGAATHSIISAMLIGMLLPIWLAAFVMPGFCAWIPVIGPSIRLTKLTLGPVLLLAMIFLMVGIISPDLKQSLGDWFWINCKYCAGSINANSAKVKAADQPFGNVTEYTLAYNADGSTTETITAGTVVRKLDWKKEIPAGAENMEWVMLPDSNGDYFAKNAVLIPARKLRWNGLAPENSYRTISVKEEKVKRTPVWKPAIMTGHVVYNHWDPKNGCGVIVGTLEPGKYEIDFDGMHQQWLYDVQKYISIPPKGQVGRKLVNQNSLPVPSAAPGARIVKFDDGTWQYAGKRVYVTLTKKSVMYVGVNLPQENPQTFAMNAGGDTIIVKRSAG